MRLSLSLQHCVLHIVLTVALAGMCPVVMQTIKEKARREAEEAAAAEMARQRCEERKVQMPEWLTFG
jgi:hypothetical protein